MCVGGDNSKKVSEVSEDCSGTEFARRRDSVTRLR